jgi:hypothetical protein
MNSVYGKMAAALIGQAVKDTGRFGKTISADTTIEIEVL